MSRRRRRRSVELCIRAVGVGAAGAAAAGPIICSVSLATVVEYLAVSSQDCTRNDLRRSKIQNFPGGGPPDPPM